MELTLRPIGVVRSPLTDKKRAPRQPHDGGDLEGTLELFPATGMLHALEDVASWSHLWVLFWFHRSPGWRPKVLPPRSTRRRGVLATRSPHRPNPLGLSLVRLVRVEGLRLVVRGLDLLDGTPVLDLKPYLPWAEAVPEASTGWLGDQAPKHLAGAPPPDPRARLPVLFEQRAKERLAWLAGEGEPLEAALVGVLSLGATPHPYRRIRKLGEGYELAFESWRVPFTVGSGAVQVRSVESGFRARELASDARGALLELHRRFTAAFGVARKV